MPINKAHPEALDFVRALMTTERTTGNIPAPRQQIVNKNEIKKSEYILNILAQK